MQAPHVPDDRPLQRLQIGGRRLVAVQHALEPLQADGEGKQVHVPAELGCPLPQFFRRHEHEVRVPEQLLLASHDAPGRG